MPICPSCNESNPTDVGICKKCGGAIPREESTQGELSEFDKEILGLMKGGKKIDAIKRYRAKTGLGLKEAKDAVESMAAEYGIESKGIGCASVLLFALVIPLAWRLLI
jgi:ribosomal protein L7/L12